MPQTLHARRILIISHGEIGSQMGGTGIRYHYMAETLQAAGFDVTVGFFSPEYMPDDAFERSYNVESVNVHYFQSAFDWANAVIALWLSEAIIDHCNTHKKVVIFDIYAPVPVENLALKVFSRKAITEADDFALDSTLKDYRLFLENGDAFLYSNQRQLDYWIGFTMGAGQVSAKGYLKRNIFEQFILAPMGIDTSQKLIKGRRLYKGVLPGVGAKDIVMIWNGGIYDWYDGVTLVEAMELVRKTNPSIKMIFPGTQHPNKTLPKWQETINTQKRASELGLTDVNVFFFDTWVDYHERMSFLLEADIAIYTHKPSIESEFSHRTRVLDHILACIPTVATEGDHFASLIKQHDLGKTVPAYDKDALAAAIVDLAKPMNLSRARRNLQTLKPEFDWVNTLAPLIAYLNTDPKKVRQINPLKPSPLQGKKVSILRRYVPKKVKKSIVRLTPAKVRKKILK